MQSSLYSVSCIKLLTSVLSIPTIHSAEQAMESWWREQNMLYTSCRFNDSRRSEFGDVEVASRRSFAGKVALYRGGLNLKDGRERETAARWYSTLYTS